MPNSGGKVGTVYSVVTVVAGTVVVNRGRVVAVVSSGALVGVVVSGGAVV